MKVIFRLSVRVCVVFGLQTKGFKLATSVLHLPFALRVKSRVKGQ